MRHAVAKSEATPLIESFLGAIAVCCVLLAIGRAIHFLAVS